MARDVLLGIDIGTSGCKAAAFDLRGTVLCHAAETYPTIHPDRGWAEQNADDWWAAVCRALHALWASGKVAPREIRGIGVAGQSWAALAVDAQGNSLRPAMIWLDRRSVPQCERIRLRIGDDLLLAHAGNPLTPGYTTGKVLWLKENEPEVYGRTGKFLQSNGWIVYKLTGAFTHDYSQGYGVHGFNIRSRTWDVEVCREIGLDVEKLADLVPSHKVVGTVRRDAAAATGLPEGIPVAAGGLDAACGTLDAGAIRPGEPQEQGGQAGGMSIVTSNPLPNPRLILGCHVVPGRWLLQGGTTGGGSLRWFRQLLGGSRPPGSWPAFGELEREAERIPPGSGGLLFLPYLAGERSPIWDPEARGTFIGLSYETERGHWVRSIMEGCAYALRHNLQTAEDCGIPVVSLEAMGGAANSEVWTQIKADVTGKEIRVRASDSATTLGAAMLAGVGVGLYRDLEEAVSLTRGPGKVYMPDPERSRKYSCGYRLYLEAYDRLQTLFPKLGGW